MRVLRFFNILLLLMVVLPGCEKAPVASPSPLLQVDGRSVTAERFSHEFVRSLPVERELTREERNDLKQAFLVQVIDRELVLAEADRLDVQVSPADVELALVEVERDYGAGEFSRLLQEQGLTRDDWRRQLSEGLRTEKVVELAAYAQVRITESDIAGYYQDHLQEFDRPEQVRARQIVVATAEEGEQLLGQLRRGEPFAEVARKNSLSPDAEEGGDLGYFSPGEMPPEFDAVVFKLPRARLSELVKSPYGYHLFLVEDRRPAQQLKLEEAAPEIRELLQRQAEEQAYEQWLRNLRSRAAIDVDMEQLSAVAEN
jgi:peptidyl-prolyl cis-trans isomerase C